MVPQVLLFGLVALQAEAAESTAAAAEAQQPSICLNETGFAFVSAAGCRAGATPFTHTGADAYNILWSVWAPTQAPHPPHTGNWSTSAATLEQMAAAKLPFARVFGSPWGWEQILLWRSSTERYWANMTRVVAKAKAVGVRLHLSITPTLSQFAIAAGCASTRELITNEGDSGCRSVLKEYVQDMVGRFKDDATILSWGMGNELNLEADGCSYNKSRGEYFSTAEMMAFSTLYVSWVKELDPLRPMGSDMGQARTRAKHLAALKGGGAACVNTHNPKGDCEVNCSAVPKDSLADFKQITKILSAPFDLVSVHTYGCYPPFAEFSFCHGDNTSIAALQAAKEVADEMGKPLFVGEFGSPACNVAGGAGWDSDECLAFPRKLLDYQVKAGIQLSNAWTWCQDGAAGWCINDGKGAEKILSMLQATDRKLNDDQHRALAKSDDTEALKTDDATATMKHHPSLLSLATDDEQAKADRPHILTIIVDDMGSYDSAINNPDSFMTQQGFGAITKEGIRLTHHMTYLYCSPSRRSILSGRFPNHIGTAQAPICSNFLPLQFTLLPARLKAAGYSTHMIGKGHLGYMTTDHMPVKRGFDSHVGFLYHGEDYSWGNSDSPGHRHHGQTNCEGSNITNDDTRFCKKDMWHNNATGWDVVNDIAYSTNFYTRRSVDLIRAHDPRQPFYLHLTYQAVHNPCEEPPLSQQIPNASVPGEWWDQTWGSMLNALDQGIASVTTALRAKDMWKNTLVVLVSDNGGDDLVSPSDPTGRTTMANNYPFRGTKLTPWEGGTRTAAVIGGGFVPVQLRGSSSDALIHIADWYPTLANIAGAIATDPVFINGSVHDVDGVDMWPAITGANTTSPRPWVPTTEGSILWQQTDGSIYKFLSNARRTILFSPNGTIRNDTSALGWNGTHAVQCVWVSPTNPDICAVCDPGHPCLFELKGDPSESRNLASDPAHASTLRVMAAKLASYVPYVGGNMSAAELEGYDCPDMDPDGSQSLWGTFVGPCCTPSERKLSDHVAEPLPSLAATTAGLA